MLKLIHKKSLLTLEGVSRGMIYLIVFFPFFMALLLEAFHLPGLLKFLPDAAWIGIVLCAAPLGKIRIRREIYPQIVIVFIFVLFTMVVYLFRYQSLFYYLWGTRNYLRFYILFWAVSTYFTREDAKKCLDIMELFFWISSALCFIQFLRGNGQDNIGGIFGTAKGCNAYVIIHLCIVVTKSILEYMNGTEKAFRCFIKCAMAMVVSAIAELKFVYLIIIAIMIMAALLTAFSMRKVMLLIICVLLVSATATLLEMLYTYFDGFLSLSSLLAMVTQKGYASNIDMGRTNAIPFISRRFLTSFPAQLFGLGLGNCDASSIGIFNTPFYTQHVSLHYSIFSYAFMFLENGYVGLLLYVLFFAVNFLQARKIIKRKPENMLFAQMGVILSAVCLIMIIYNSSLRIEAGYMMYFGLSLPFVFRERNREQYHNEMQGIL